MAFVTQEQGKGQVCNLRLFNHWLIMGQGWEVGNKSRFQ
jgi:hypothetical protein